MSILDNITTKINEVKDTLNPFKTMSVSNIVVEDDLFDWVFEYVDYGKLKNETIDMSDKYINVWENELHTRLAYYICRYFLMNPGEYKVDFKPIIKRGKTPIPILLTIMESIDSHMVMNLIVTLPTGKRMIIKYSRF